VGGWERAERFDCPGLNPRTDQNPGGGGQAPEAVFATAIEVPAEGGGGGVQPSPIGPRARNPMTAYAPANQLAPATPTMTNGMRTTHGSGRDRPIGEGQSGSGCPTATSPS
jgi:hypothetical protein